MNQPRLRMRLGDLLVSQSIISDDQLQLALQQQKQHGRKLGATLLELGFLTETQLLSFLAQQLGIEFVDLNQVVIQPQVVQLLPEVHARRYRALAINLSDGEVTVAMSDPSDLAAMDAIDALLAPNRMKLVAVRESQLLAFFDQLYRRTREIASFAEQLQEEFGSSDFDMAQLTEASSEHEGTVVKLLRSLFEDAVQVHASDIHIEPDETVLRIRQRIDGVLHESVLNEVRIASALVLRLKLVAGLDISEKRMPQDGRFNIQVRGHEIDIRISTMPVQHGESVVMRLLDHSAGLLSLNDTGMPAAMLERFRRQLRRPHGMIVVTGPTGSGKTTTLYGAISELNVPSNKIISVEDPVEYRLPRINQVQVNTKIGLGFAQVLRASLRQDPDILLVGEMRDHETVEIGLRGAMTGHLVLTTLHTNDAIASALRLIDMGAAGYLVASALRTVIAQRLVRRICPHCREIYQPEPGQMAWLVNLFGSQAHDHLYSHGRGCQSCSFTGYAGRVGVFELLEFDDAMTEALRQADPESFTLAARASHGYQSLVNVAYEYACQGVTTIDEVLKLAEVTD